MTKLVIDPTLSVSTQVKALGLFQMGPSTGVLLYKFFDADYGLLYVGVTCTPTTRWQSHKNTAQWWSAVRWVEVERYPYNNAALAAERMSIRQDRPRFNLRSFPGRSRNAPGIAPDLARARLGDRRQETGDRRKTPNCDIHPSLRSVTRKAWMGSPCQ